MTERSGPAHSGRLEGAAPGRGGGLFHRGACLVWGSLVLAGCSGQQSAVDAKGEGAAEILRLIWLFTGVCTLVWVLVMAVLIGALIRRRGERADPLALEPDRERRFTRVIIAASGATAVIIIGLTFVSYLTNKSLAELGTDSELTIRVTGRQWWWEARYEDGPPNRWLTAANEIHIPVGEPVRFILTSTDVIHSFWVPSLAGKQDLITGRENVLHVVAREPGVYRGQCAEFCGAQHAHMGLLIIAEPREAFEAWRNAQLQPAPEPTEPERIMGRDAFVGGPCALCHKIRGTLAGGTVGPELTHVGSQRTIAAGTLSMSRGNLAAWIADPQGIKPGAHMPTMLLDPDRLNAIVAYLEGLK